MSDKNKTVSNAQFEAALNEVFLKLNFLLRIFITLMEILFYE
jgi:hypothetical protein